MLYLAAQDGNATVAAVLLAYGTKCDRVISTDIAPVSLNHDLKLTELPTRGTALQFACLDGHREVVDVLLEGRVQRNTTTPHGWEARSWLPYTLATPT